MTTISEKFLRNGDVGCCEASNWEKISCSLWGHDSGLWLYYFWSPVFAYSDKNILFGVKMFFYVLTL